MVARALFCCVVGSVPLGCSATAPSSLSPSPLVHHLGVQFPVPTHTLTSSPSPPPTPLLLSPPLHHTTHPTVPSTGTGPRRGQARAGQGDDHPGLGREAPVDGGDLHLRPLRLGDIPGSWVWFEGMSSSLCVCVWAFHASEPVRLGVCVAHTPPSSQHSHPQTDRRLAAPRPSRPCPSAPTAKRTVNAMRWAPFPSPSSCPPDQPGPHPFPTRGGQTLGTTHEPTTGRVQMQTRGSRFVRYQELRIQELPDQVPMGACVRASGASFLE